jgi:hypothetical protein
LIGLPRFAALPSIARVDLLAGDFFLRGDGDSRAEAIEVANAAVNVQKNHLPLDNAMMRQVLSLLA